MAVEQMDTAGEAVNEAEAFLGDTLRAGPVPTREIKTAANANGHTWRTLERAKKSMGVVAVKGGFNAGWSWQLPASNTANQGSEDRLQD